MNKEIENSKVEEAMANFCPFGYRDIAVALEAIQEASGKEYLDTDELYQICNDFVDSTGMKMEELDPVACVYDYYHQIARTDIERATGKDISNDEPYSGVNVYGNYMCTSFDGTEEEINALKELIETIPEAERSSAVKWLFNIL